MRYKISVKWSIFIYLLYIFTETFSEDFLEDPEKLRQAACFHSSTFVHFHEY